MRRTATLCAALVFCASVATAQSVEDSVVQQLQAQGFHRFEVQRTLLGRLRIEAYSDTLERELVINPTTGEVLRDYWEPIDDDDRQDRTPRLRDPNDDDDDDRDEDDKEEADDDKDDDDDDDDDDEDDDDDDDEDDDDDDDEDDDDDDDEDDEE